MVKQHYEEKLQKTKVVDEIICNKCGKSFTPKYMGVGHYENSQVHKFRTDFGYGSEYDGKTLEFDLCEKCLLKFVKTFKVKSKPFDIWDKLI
jgi:hypothetical protein